MAPPDLVATAGAGSVTLSWGESQSDAGLFGYRLYRLNADGTWPTSQFATTNPWTRTFTVTGLEGGTAYTFRVRALDLAGNYGDYSNEATATPADAPVTPLGPVDVTPPTAPEQLTAAPGDGSVTLNWSESQDAMGLFGYRVYRRNADGTWPASQFATTNPQTRTFKVTGLQNGTSYEFRVRALDLAGNYGGYSASAAATPSAADGGACPAYGPFEAGSWPGVCWRPYADTSPFNRPIPATPRLLANSGQIVARLLSWGAPQKLLAGHSGTADDYFHPLYYAQPSDPLFTIHCALWTSSCAIEGMQVRIPDAAQPAAGGDGHMTVIDQASGWEYDFWQVTSKPAGGGTLTISHGGRTRIDGDGLGSNATAAWFGLAAGIIRGQEMQAGQINHALFSQIKCSGGYAVYPAQPGTTAAPCSNFGASNTDAPPLGARIQLDMSDTEIDALAVPAWKKTILTALAHYGLIVGDTMNNNSSWGLQGESGSSYTSFGATDPWVTFAHDAGLLPNPDGRYVLDIGTGVDWSRLRVLDPCVSQGTC